MNREELYHFGIIGMKWGVRRYQNEDGSLTEAGRKRLREKSRHYMNSRLNIEKHPFTNIKNRLKVEKEYVDTYNNLVDKYGIDRYRRDGNYVNEQYKKASGNNDLNDLYVKKFFTKYVDASLDDLGFEKTPQAKQFVADIYYNDLLTQRLSYGPNAEVLVDSWVDGIRDINRQLESSDFKYWIKKK